MVAMFFIWLVLYVRNFRLRLQLLQLCPNMVILTKNTSNNLLLCQNSLIRLTEWHFAGRVEGRWTGELKQLRLRQTVLLCFYSLYLHSANGATRQICPLHYLHLVFIRAVLTCVPGDRWEFFSCSLLQGEPKWGAILGPFSLNGTRMIMGFHCLCLDLFIY